MASHSKELITRSLKCKCNLKKNKKISIQLKVYFSPKHNRILKSADLPLAEIDDSGILL